MLVSHGRLQIAPPLSIRRSNALPNRISGCTRALALAECCDEISATSPPHPGPCLSPGPVVEGLRLGRESGVNPPSRSPLHWAPRWWSGLKRALRGPEAKRGVGLSLERSGRPGEQGKHSLVRSNRVMRATDSCFVTISRHNGGLQFHREPDTTGPSRGIPGPTRTTSQESHSTHESSFCTT